MDAVEVCGIRSNFSILRVVDISAYMQLTRTQRRVPLEDGREVLEVRPTTQGLSHSSCVMKSSGIFRQ